MGEWVKVDEKPFQSSRTRKHGTVSVSVFVSPYDIPDAVRGDFDKAQRRFVIEFRYFADEPVVDFKSRDLDPFCRVVVGSRSRRLHRIEIDTDTLGAQSVTLELFSSLVKALETFGQKHRAELKGESVQIANSILTGQAAPILEAMQA